MDLASVTVDRAQLDGLVGAVRAVTKNQQDAEDAVQDAWIVLHEKAAGLDDGPVGGYWMRTARFKGMHIRDRKKAVSLDALVQIAGDSVNALSDGAFSLEACGELAELAIDPVGKQILHSTAHGGAPQLAPRGENHQFSVYSDDQVQRVRELRTANLTCREIEEITGVPRGYVPTLARRNVGSPARPRGGVGSAFLGRSGAFRPATATRQPIELPILSCRRRKPSRGTSKAGAQHATRRGAPQATRGGGCSRGRSRRSSGPSANYD